MNYLLMGTESFNLNQRKNEIIKSVLVDDTMNLYIHNYTDENDLIDLVMECNTYPFLADNKVIVYDNPAFLLGDSKNSIDVLVNYLKDPNDYTTLILTLDKSLNSNTTIYKTLSKYIHIEKFEKITATEFVNYIKNDIKSRNIKIDKDALDLLIERLPVDVSNYQNEIDKLVTYGKKIDYETVDNLVSPLVENDVFKLTNAINNNDLANSIKILRDLLSNNKNDVLALIGLIASQYRSMNQVLLLHNLGYSNNAIAEELAVSSGSVYYKLKECSNLSNRDLMDKLNQLATLDEQIKTGKIEPVNGLELFIVRNVRS